MNLDRLSDDIIQAAIKDLKTLGDVLPVVLVFKEGRATPILIKMLEGVEHREIYAPVREYIEKIKPDVVFTVNGAWVAEGDTGVRPSERPDRKEIIVVVMTEKNIGTKGWVVKFDRTEKTDSNPHGIGQIFCSAPSLVMTNLIDPWWEQAS